MAAEATAKGSADGRRVRAGEEGQRPEGYSRVLQGTLRVLYGVSQGAARVVVLRGVQATGLVERFGFAFRFAFETLPFSSTSASANSSYY